MPDKKLTQDDLLGLKQKNFLSQKAEADAIKKHVCPPKTLKKIKEILAGCRVRA